MQRLWKGVEEMINIPLRDDLRIRRWDDRNIIIEQDQIHKKRKTGEEYEVQIILGYYNTLESAVLSAIERGYLEGDVNTLEDYLNDLERVKREIIKGVVDNYEI